MLLSSLLLATILGLTPGPITTVGTGEPGDSGDGGPAALAKINQPFDLVFSKAGDLYFSDTGNHKIRRVDAKTGLISTIAGNGSKGFSGDGGPAVSAKLDEPYGVVLDGTGNLYFADRLNRRVRRVDAATGIISTVAGDGSKVFSGDSGPANRTGLVEPNGVALDQKGRLLIADVADHRVRSVDLSTGRISTFAGDGMGRHAGDGGPAVRASIHGARAVDVGSDGTVYILERGGNTLRAVDPTTGVITTKAGTGKVGYSGDGGPARAATFNGPKELCVDRNEIHIVDTENHAIRLVNLRNGTIRTAFGPGPDVPRAQRLDRPHGVAVDPTGVVVIADTNHHRIRPALVP